MAAKDLNVELGLTAKFFDTWKLNGGYKYDQGTSDGKERKDTHLFIVKQERPEGEMQTLNVGDFIKSFIEEINKLANLKPKKEDVRAEEQMLKGYMDGLPEGLNDFLELFEVYMNQVYLKVETQINMKKTDGGFQPDDKKNEKEKPDVEYAFWIGIRMTKEVRDAIADPQKDTLPDGKPIPFIFNSIFSAHNI